MPNGLSAPPFGSIAPTRPSFLFGDPSTFAAAAATQGSDYDRIMADYARIASQPIRAPESITAPQIPPSSLPQITAPTISPALSAYSRTADVTGSLANLSNLATTGGYSDADIANIRARGISPIRSIYANAQQNVDRQRALAGGYSPNYNAVQAQMARDEAQQIADESTNVEATIAQNRAQNRLSAAAPYASAAGAESALSTSAAQRNADIINQINQANVANQLNIATGNRAVDLQTAEANRAAAMQAAEGNRAAEMAVATGNRDAATQAALASAGGRASLYGTTPALTQTFGNQVAQAGQLSQNQQDIRNRRLGVLGSIVHV